MRRRAAQTMTCLLLCGFPSLSHAQDAGGDGWQPGFGVEAFVSSDTDKTSVIKLAGRALFDFDGAGEYRGIVVEQVWFTPLGQETVENRRVDLDLANKLGKWRWKARVGTDGATVLGSASIRREDWSQELFVERELVETPQGIAQGIYYTFAGADADIPLDQRNLFTGMAGLQAFSGTNTRYHLRASYIHVVKPGWGLSVQLHARYYHSSHPGEFDYYSPRDCLRLLPMLQLRRFDHGWEYRLQLAYGAQRATSSGWSDARYADLRLESPRLAKTWELRAEISYSNTSLTSGPDYNYVVGTIGITKRL